MSEIMFKEGDQVEIVNAVNPAYHDKGDILPVWSVDAEAHKLILPDGSGGATHYSFDDVKLSTSESVKSLKLSTDNVIEALRKYPDDPLKMEAARHLELLKPLANAGIELASYASYSEIVGGITSNRAPIRKWCDAVYDLKREADLDDEDE